MRLPHNTDADLVFYNDRVKEVVAAADLAEPFTYIPITAGHMELVGGNALVFGRIKEGYDVIIPEVETELSFEDISNNNTVIPLKVDYLQTSYSLAEVGYTIRRYITGIVRINLPLNIYSGGIYYVSVINVSRGISLTASYTVLLGDSIVEVRAGLVTAMVNAGFEDAVAYGTSGISCYPAAASFSETPPQFYEAGDINTMYGAYTFSASILVSGYVIKFPQLKSGASHGFGIVYKDRSGRLCSVMRPTSMNVYIPFCTEESGGNINTLATLIFSIRHAPPSWAESYEIVYYGNLSMTFFLQIRANEIVDINDDRFTIDVNGTIEDAGDRNNRWKVPPYTWQDGDRVRLIGTIDIITGAVTEYTTLYDYEIEASGTRYGESVGGDWLVFQAVDHPMTFAGATNILLEIYHPVKGLGKTTPYGAGMVFKILTDENGYKYHEGDIDQAFDDNGACTVPAEVDNTANDSWKFSRLNYKAGTGIIFPFWAESYYPCDWWESLTASTRLTSMGFAFLDDLSMRQTDLHERIRHGGFLITGTRTNNIAHFTYDDFVDLPKKNGDITGLREVGFTLKIIQMHKETSIYINRIQTFNPDGTEQFTLTDKFLAEQRPMETDYGCQNPDSIMVNGRNLYYWDNNEGAFIRSAPNGQKVLSGPDYKMFRWFKDMLAWVQESGGRSSLIVNIGANNEHEEIWVTFRVGDEIKGVIFSEKQGRFISQINQITESYLHLGNFFAHLYHQRLWIMNIDEGQDWLSWSGTPTYAEVEVVSNVESGKNKIFRAIAAMTDHLWQSLSKYVHIPAEASGCGALMESNVPVFDRREGIYFGKIMKDENSPGVFVDVYDRKLNGREMRGRYCFVKLKIEEHDEKVRMDSITIFSTPSERNI